METLKTALFWALIALVLGILGYFSLLGWALETYGH